MTKLEEITSERVEQFFRELGKTKSKRTGKVLSLSSLRIYMTTLNRFGKYLRQSKQGSLVVPVKFKSQSNKRIAVLSREEIERIYEVTDDSLLGMRDRALLSVFYGCGARRNEAVNILSLIHI